MWKQRLKDLTASHLQTLLSTAALLSKIDLRTEKESQFHQLVIPSSDQIIQGTYSANWDFSNAGIKMQDANE